MIVKKMVAKRDNKRTASVLRSSKALINDGEDCECDGRGGGAAVDADADASLSVF